MQNAYRPFHLEDHLSSRWVDSFHLKLAGIQSIKISGRESPSLLTRPMRLRA